MHHHIILNAPDTEHLRGRLERSGVNESAAIDIETWYAGTLQEAPRVLRTLGELGFQLVLHGHQHYSGPIHLHIPQEPDNPVAHDGLTLMAAGSAGISPLGDQPSAPSFQYYQIRKELVSWAVKSTRFVIRKEGTVRPFFEVLAEDPISFPCYSVRAERILTGVSRVLHPPSEHPRGPLWNDSRPWYTQPFNLSQSLVAGCPFFRATSIGIPLDDLRLELTGGDDSLTIHSDAPPEAQTDLLVMIAASVARTLGKSGVYADLDHLSLHEVIPSGNTVVLRCGITTYLHYLSTAMSLYSPLDDHESFWSRHLNQVDFGNAGCVKRLNELLKWTRYVSKRITLQAIFEVQGGTETTVILKARSLAVGHMQGRVQFAVGGGFKVPLLGADRRLSMECAFAAEILLETGLSAGDLSMPTQAVCLTVNKETLAPAVTAVVCLSEPEFLERFEPTGEPALDQMQGTWWRPRRPPRDWWETTKLLRVHLGEGVSLVGSWRQASTAWIALGRIYGTLEKEQVDPYPASAISLLAAPGHDPLAARPARGGKARRVKEERE